MKTENGKETRGMRIRVGLLMALILCILTTVAFAGYGNYGNSYGRLSVNRYASGVTNDSYRLALQLKALRDSY